MILTNKEKYAIIAVIDMLEGDIKNSGSIPVSLASIASRQKISLSFLEQIFSALKKANIVKSIRGPNGGYILAKKPKDISVADIVFAIKEPTDMTRCGSKDGCVTKKTRCKTHDLWRGLEQNIYNYLSAVSIDRVNNNFSQSNEGKNFF